MEMVDGTGGLPDGDVPDGDVPDGGVDDVGHSEFDLLLTVPVDGESHAYPAVYLDGTLGVEVTTDDGSYAYTDTDGDGVADHLVARDASGAVVTTAGFDTGDGEWHEITPSSAAEWAGMGHLEDGSGGAPGAVADTVSDEVGDVVADAGPPTVDTTGDGRPDTSVTTSSAGDTTVVTDVDGDGRADYVTRIDHEGHVTTYEHQGEEWVVTGSEELGGP